MTLISVFFGSRCWTSPVVLRWLCDSPRTGCARRTKIYVCGANEQYKVILMVLSWWSPLIMLVNLVNSWLCLLTVTTRVISSGDLYCCLLPRCKALRSCRSGFPIATTPCRKLAANRMSLETVRSAVHGISGLICLNHPCEVGVDRSFGLRAGV